MAELNRAAAEVMSGFDVAACTDITGFGLLGHGAEMVCGSGKSIRLRSADVPVIFEALEFAAMGLIPEGAHRNREFRAPMLVFAETVPLARQDVLVDPQTSGGLLISVKAQQSEDLVSALKQAGVDAAARIGEVIDNPEEKIWVV